nr:FkbM family methyltransferase [Candidatus Calescibacterium sp.]
MPSTLQKLSWRANLLKKALLSFPIVDWKGVFREIFSSHSRAYPKPLLLERDGDFGLYQVADRRVWFPLSFDPSVLGFVYDEIFVQDIYEWGPCHIRPGDWVVDAGACEGFFSLYALEKGANVLAFEPVPELAQALEKTLSEFIKAGRAKVYPLGLGREKEEKTMFILRDGAVGGSTFSDKKMDFHRHDVASAVKVPLQIVSLDLLLFSGSLPPISFIKADVEGYECELLLGAQETVRRYRPRLSICTYHLPDDWRVIPRMIRRFGVGYKMKFSGLLDHLYGW